MIINIIEQIPGILIAISVHEFGHALMAYMLGDDTAKRYGRLTLDPFKHIDAIGMIVMFIARFGWAKPVPVDERNFKVNKRLGIFLVSISGPIFNIITAILIIYIFKLQYIFLNIYALNRIIPHIYRFNIIFACFNLIPIPPLDGSKILLSILPNRLIKYYYKYEEIGNIVLLLLIFTNNISLLIMPIYTFINSIVVLFV
ncbi:Zn-dependent protease (includes SpoIVFB) [Alkalithermobacter thermoalcaliphilus JW-YL-7 = DSM 7308]|uniref:Peptidase M50 n=1 Tax=Alkalithermobacter thermoalcaliphilus JW-YL-7 = DSM 7308 TaxID=1121328 RepID=A0A150FQP1_CLOPD|nr:peptidase M50 [[Clostridium] paradoxum JW-YL-7 = DSM 7308]SHK77263.1 Zn-dependent protease (includes SpoIVFB) [[Clostridium] paradoxum JW-YL-7 = DSM 7308]